MTKPFKRLIAKAEAQSEELARIGREIEEASWEIDSTLSAIRKDAAGYRTANAANRDGGANYEDGELEAAVRRAETLLLSLQPATDRLRQIARTKELTAALKAADLRPNFARVVDDPQLAFVSDALGG